MKRRLLLTSSQVSVLVTTAVGRSPTPPSVAIRAKSWCCTVLLFTTALFLSGYAIQQRTLRELRRSIREPPRPSPKTYLPDRFKSTTTELEDGTVVIIESEAEREAREQAENVVIVKQTHLEEPAQDSTVEEGASPAAPVLDPDKSEREWKLQQQAEKNQKNPDPLAKDQKPISRAERRRLIKEEIHKLSHFEEPVYYQRRLW
jgi:hypothetical protein